MNANTKQSDAEHRRSPEESDAEVEAERRRLIEDLQAEELEPDLIVDGLTWFCPQGHEAYNPRSPARHAPECGRCGARMETDGARFYAVVGRIEDAGIALFEDGSETRGESGG